MSLAITHLFELTIDIYNAIVVKRLHAGKITNLAGVIQLFFTGLTGYQR
jgi:hypothetical protein